MAANTIHIPDDLLAQVERMAASQGRTADELAADALKRYLAREWVNRIAREGEENRLRLGLHTEEDVEAYVNGKIAESRSERRGR